eukprot:7402126-Prorocentrum_lima.AAC.1
MTRSSGQSPAWTCCSTPAFFHHSKLCLPVQATDALCGNRTGNAFSAFAVTPILAVAVPMIGTLPSCGSTCPGCGDA